MKTTNFHKDLALSQSPKITAAIWKIISDHFPEADAITPADIDDDKKGTDYWIDFSNGKRESLDYKIRYKDYYDTDPLHRTAFIELVANTTSGKLGWSIDPMKQTDHVLFYYADTVYFKFYSARELRGAILKYLNHLKKSGQPFTTTTATFNGGSYESTGIVVSHEELERCISAYKHVNRKAA